MTRRLASAPDSVASAICSILDGDSEPLYLCDRPGPASYLLREENGTKVKVLLGDPNSCSCGSGEESCVHVLFVLLKILRVPRDDEICWQRGFSEREIDELLRGERNATSVGTSRGQSSDSSAPKHQFLRKRAGLGQRGRSVVEKYTSNNQAEESPDVERKPLSEGDICPICQEDLPQEAEEVNKLAYCRVSCGKSLHVKCMKIWAEHQTSVGNSVNCPLCRVSWGDMALMELAKKAMSISVKKAKRRFHNVKCRQCNSASIKGDLFRCLLCPSFFDLCKGCYESANCLCMRKSHPFLAKTSPGDSWRSAPPLRQLDRIGAHSRIFAELASREFTSEDYDLLLGLDDPFSGSVQARTFVEMLLKTLVRYTSNDEGQDCALCERPLGLGIAKLVPCCKAVVHDSCAGDLCVAQQDKGSCQLCSKPMFPGLRVDIAPLPQVPQTLHAGKTVLADQPSIPLLSVSGLSFGPSSLSIQPEQVVPQKPLHTTGIDPSRSSPLTFSSSFAPRSLSLHQRGPLALPTTAAPRPASRCEGRRARFAKAGLARIQPPHATGPPAALSLAGLTVSQLSFESETN